MALDPEDIGVIQSIVSNMLVKLLPGLLPREGVTADSSGWNPQENVAAHTFGHTALPIDEDDGQVITRQGIPHATGAFGVQYGPRGNERSVLIKTDCGYVALFRHGNDGTIQDSPGAPSGELHIVHYDENFNQNAWMRLTNDGPNPGDNLAGIVKMVGALYSMSTAAGQQIVARDDLNQIGLGTDPINLSSQNNAVRFTDLDDALQNKVRIMVGNALLKYTQAIVNLGGLPSSTNATSLFTLLDSGAGFPSITELTSLIPGMADITTPTCSEAVLIK